MRKNYYSIKYVCVIRATRENPNIKNWSCTALNVYLTLNGLHVGRSSVFQQPQDDALLMEHGTHCAREHVHEPIVRKCSRHVVVSTVYSVTSVQNKTATEAH